MCSFFNSESTRKSIMQTGSIGNIRLLTGNSNPELAKKIADYMDIELVKAEVDRFADGETHVKMLENIRESDVFVLQSTCPPVNENLMELLIMIDCLRRASVGRITAVIPYYGYARQDRKDEGRVPISAKLVANLLTHAEANRILTMDLHAAQIQGFFDIPVDNLYGNKLFLDYFKDLKKITDNLAILAPDVGSSKRAGFFAKHLDVPLAIIDKRRISDTETNVMAIIGSVKDKDVLIPDDMIATGGTIVQAIQTAKSQGAKDVYLSATHPIFAGSAVEKLAGSEVKEVVVTDTVPIPKVKRFDALSVLSTAEIIGKAIKRIHSGESVSSLFSVN